MSRDECGHLEQALAAESDLDEALRLHVEDCPRCSALMSIAGLMAPPVVGGDDRVARAVMDKAREIADHRARRWERRRRIMPLVVGAAGWMIGVMLMGVALVAGRGGGTAEASARTLADDAGMMATLLSAPPIDARVIAVMFVVTAVWLAVVAAWSRARGLAAGGGETGI